MHNQTHQNDDKQMVRQRSAEPAGPQLNPGFQPVTAANAASISRMPGRGGTQLRRAALTQLQRSHGNGFVQRFLAPDMQRMDIPGMQPAGSNYSQGGGGGGGGNNPGGSNPAGPAGGGTSIGDGTATLTAAGGTISGSAAMMNIDAAFVKFPGVLQVGTIVADTVVGSSYTPGAGNIW
ncbi:MAG: hypothetical protein KDE09_24865 [Anaerolineales bacterium]|nr:hypothetical protein [Anaerolineales bacterium]MCB0004928.1 hypothetical protein [Anaerolineales bacterium]MCB0013901.1 hypothetical protein [Anaerolineales bacterium]MCB0021061.1 hypothetical protein [Anaerolineales bacterium]MCB0029611.1 hypothetical protein [Anaerolineales bacterium]